MADDVEVHVLVPDEFGGVCVVSVADLAVSLVDDIPLDDVLTNCGIESGEATPELIERVRKLNATGNADEFWSRK